MEVQIISDESVDLFRTVSFIEHVRFRFSGSVTLNEKFFCVRNIVNRMLGDFDAGYNLTTSINGNRCFQESLSYYSGPPGIIRIEIDSLFDLVHEIH
jgi:hypothetical protein